LRAIGRIGNGSVFSGTLRKALEMVKDETKMSSDNRASACWAAGRLRPVDPKLTARLVKQATTPVIPDPMGMMMFEMDYVLASAAFALTQCGRDDSAARSQAEKVLRIHGATPDPGTLTDTILVPTPEIKEAARQARAYLEGKEIERALRPTQEVVFSYKQCEPEELPEY
jgi:hypothetical protein